MLLILLSIIIGFLFSAAVLFIVTKLLKLGDQTFVTAMKTTGVIAVAGILFNLLANALPEASRKIMGYLSFILISVSLAIYMIKTNYKLEFRKALLVWAIWIVLAIIIAILFVIVVVAVVPLIAK